MRYFMNVRTFQKGCPYRRGDLEDNEKTQTLGNTFLLGTCKKKKPANGSVLGEYFIPKIIVCPSLLSDYGARNGWTSRWETSLNWKTTSLSQ